ncbi:alpha-amylase [bacterium]|nr:alpha-amylase [bacterium]
MREFHISRVSRQKYRFEDTLFALTGNVIFANYHAARIFAHQMNQKRDLILYPEQAVKAADIYAMGLIDEILHYIVSLYRDQVKSRVFEEALDDSSNLTGNDAVSTLLHRFVNEFPSRELYRGKQTPQIYLSNPSHPPVILEEILFLWLANSNPAFSPYCELFDDTILDKSTQYHRVIEGLKDFFKKQPPFGPDNQNLIDMLRAPVKASPHSLAGQIDFIRTRWKSLIQDRYLYKLLSSLDFLQEEAKAGGLGSGPVTIPEYAIGREDKEQFSPDLHWMPKVVMIAKNAYVWLDQLSKQTGESLTRLDQIPDQTLDDLARWGFTALWLIGVWERSPASKRIKQMCGNPEAEASAYALYDYQIAADLGGNSSFDTLKKRAWQRGIRMAGDMVPNHVGIDSRWLIEHPDWFISLPFSPYPAYTFNGPDLCNDDRVGIFLEDHYYNRSDAAVVFKRLDHWTGEERYIYHGNDGTGMPWNDTAQLNFLNPDVREAVIQTILHVARQFPVIRFDAAMTLTQKHFQRLWFPESGQGGDIPSRAEQGFSKSHFLKSMPREFWREVVDRIAAEVPDTLLLAEAFWLLEGYFVRTLGMHRVYNSAFMNMLKNEDNAGYRNLIRKTLEFNREILKRYVNFMNNPDEDTAIAQFGREDKYFGVCLLMATMPGLPMFGHGQIEGFSEKYGMEYRRAYWEEQPDSELIRRHEREVFPALGKRYLFAEVENYCLFDLMTEDGHANENVFVQSNRSGDERALYVYHNIWADTRGWIRTSIVTGQSLGDALGLNRHGGAFTVFQDHISGLEYIRYTHDFFRSGLYVELGAFKYHLFWYFRQLPEDADYHTLYNMLNGRGVPSIDTALKELVLKPVLDPFQSLIHPKLTHEILDLLMQNQPPAQETINDLESRIAEFYTAVNSHVRGKGNVKSAVERTIMLVKYCFQPYSKSQKWQEFYDSIRPEFKNEWLAVWGWALIHTMGLLKDEADAPTISRSWMDELHLVKSLQQMCESLGFDPEAQWEIVALIKILVRRLVTFSGSHKTPGLAAIWCRILLGDSEVQQFVQMNRYREILYFNQERFEMLIRSTFFSAHMQLHHLSASGKIKAAGDLVAMMKNIKKAEEESGYQVDRFLEGIETRDKKQETKKNHKKQEARNER